MNNFVNFDTLSYGIHFEDDKGNKFIKLKSRTDWMGWTIYYVDDWGNKNTFNAVSYKGETKHFLFTDKVKIIDVLPDKTESGYSFNVENDLLWRFVELVAESCDCQCGQPPFVDDKPCPPCFAKKFRENITTEEIEKVVDSSVPSDKVVGSSAIVVDDMLKNKQIETTNKMLTFNTLTEAVTAAINELKATGTLSLHQISTLIRQKTNDSLWEVLDCMARPNNQNIKYWINHDDVRRIVNDMYANQQLDALGFTGRTFNGTFMEYNFDTNSTNFVTTTPTAQANVSTQPGPVLTAAPAPNQQYFVAAISKADAYVKSQIASGSRPTLKSVQSAVKISGITCEDFKAIVENLGYKVTPTVTDCFSTYIVG